MNKLKPCDCKDIATASKLNEIGISVNENSITIEPNVVIMKIDHTTIKIPMNLFKKFSEWYLLEQTIK